MSVACDRNDMIVSSQAYKEVGSVAPSDVLGSTRAHGLESEGTLEL